MHFLFVLAFVLQIMVYDAWKLITPEVVLQRWLMAATLLAGTAIIWALARAEKRDSKYLKRLVVALLALDIAFAGILVYMTRGMASKAVILFVFPIIVAGVLESRRALYATSFVSLAAYTTAAVSYFVLNFNEGYKIELYGEISFYAVILVFIAGLAWSVIKPDKRG